MTLFKRMMRRMKGLMLRNMYYMITCRDFDAFIVAYLDDELDSKTRRRFEFHIRLCRDCREYLNAYKRAIELGQTVVPSTEDNLPEDVPKDLIEAILKTRDES